MTTPTALLVNGLNGTVHEKKKASRSSEWKGYTINKHISGTCSFHQIHPRCYSSEDQNRQSLWLSVCEKTERIQNLWAVLGAARFFVWLSPTASYSLVCFLPFFTPTLWSTNIAMENITILVGKSTINSPFSSSQTVSLPESRYLGKSHWSPCSPSSWEAYPSPHPPTSRYGFERVPSDMPR